MKRNKDDIPKWLKYLVIIMVLLFLLALLFGPGYDHSWRPGQSFPVKRR